MKSGRPRRRSSNSTGMYPAKNGTIAITVPTARTIDRPKDGGLPGRAHAQAKETHAGCLSRSAPEQDEVAPRKQQPAACEQDSGQPGWAKPSDQRSDEACERRKRREGHEDQTRVDPERESARGDAGERARRGARTALGPIVERDGAAANADDQLLGEPRRLPGQRGPNLGPRDHLLDRTPHLVALHDAIHELVRARAFQRVVEGSVERSALCELFDHALEHAVPHERARDLLRQRAREGAVDQAGDLGDDHVVGRRAELVAGSPRR